MVHSCVISFNLWRKKKTRKEEKTLLGRKLMKSRVLSTFITARGPLSTDVFKTVIWLETSSIQRVFLKLTFPDGYGENACHDQLWCEFHGTEPLNFKGCVFYPMFHHSQTFSKYKKKEIHKHATMYWAIKSTLNMNQNEVELICCTDIF